MYKVVVSDLDGTLLNSDQEVSELSKRVIRKLMEMGIQFYIATGRAYPDAKQIMESIGIKIPLITANGGVINDEYGKEIYRNNLEEKYRDEVSYYIFVQYIFFEQWDKLKDYLHKNGIQTR